MKKDLHLCPKVKCPMNIWAYFSNGVMDVLMEQDIRADYLIGASAGIANGISYASWQHGRSLRLGVEYLHDKRYMGIKYLF